jgi:hypothetical protein
MKKPKIRTSLCKLDKHDMEERMDDIVSLVSDPKFICRKCARVAINKNYLCKPVKIKSSAKNGS